MAAFYSCCIFVVGVFVLVRLKYGVKRHVKRFYLGLALKVVTLQQQNVYSRTLKRHIPFGSTADGLKSCRFIAE